jgi:hypothetical protein
MKRKELLTAMDSGVPFEIKMADSTRHKVSGPYRVALGRSIAMVVTDDDLPRLVRLANVRDISYARPK